MGMKNPWDFDLRAETQHESTGAKKSRCVSPHPSILPPLPTEYSGNSPDLAYLVSPVINLPYSITCYCKFQSNLGSWYSSNKPCGLCCLVLSHAVPLWSLLQTFLHVRIPHILECHSNMPAFISSLASQCLYWEFSMPLPVSWLQRGRDSAGFSTARTLWLRRCDPPIWLGKVKRSFFSSD